MLCSICNEKESKYTCPKCASRYCSLICFKSEKHKAMDEDIQENELKKEDKKEENDVAISSNNDDVQKIDDPMLSKLCQVPKFQEYMSSPILQFHILTVLEILDNVSLTNEYSKDGRVQIASRKINDLRNGGVEANEYVDEFINWLLIWIEEYNEN